MTLLSICKGFTKIQYFLSLTVAREPDADVVFEVPAAELAGGRVVGVLQPRQVTLNHALQIECIGF